MLTLSAGFCLYLSKSKLFVLQLFVLFFILYAYYPNALRLDGGQQSFWYIYTPTLNLGFLLIGILQERGIDSFYGLSKVILAVLLLAVSYYFLDGFSRELKNILDTNIFPFDLHASFKMNQLSFLLSCITLSFLLLFALFFFENQNDQLIVWIFLYLIAPALFYAQNTAFAIFNTLASLLIIITLMKNTYAIAYQDALTQIPSRRALEDDFLKLGSRYTLAMVDIDFFKKFNDTHGHDIGDEVLKLVAKQLSEVKGGGKAYRYGGEEFIIVFTNKDSDTAYMYAQEVRENIATRGFILRDRAAKQSKKAKPLKLTVSIGLASNSKTNKTPQEVMKQADNALYKAKENGRNCVIKADV